MRRIKNFAGFAAIVILGAPLVIVHALLYSKGGTIDEWRRFRL